MQTFLVLSHLLLLMPFSTILPAKKSVYLQIDIFGNSEWSLTMPQVQCWASGNWYEKSLKCLLTHRSSSCSPVLTWPSGPRSSAAAPALQSEKALPKQAALSSQADSSPISSAPRWRHSFLTSLGLPPKPALKDLPLSARWNTNETVGASSQKVLTAVQLSLVTGPSIKAVCRCSCSQLLCLRCVHNKTFQGLPSTVISQVDQYKDHLTLKA